MIIARPRHGTPTGRHVIARRLATSTLAALIFFGIIAASPAGRTPAGSVIAPAASVVDTPARTPDPDSVSTDVLRLIAPALEKGLSFDADLRAQALVAAGGVTADEIEFHGSGVLTVVDGEQLPPDPERRPYTYLLRVEEGIGIDQEIFAGMVFDILNDPRGWGPIDGVSFGRTSDPYLADITLTLASPATTQHLCGDLPTGGYTSCGVVGNVNINAARWAHNAEAFMAAGGSDEDYRFYVINHEFGHLLGYWHVPCPGVGEPAPVMLQQTLDLQGCVPNGWPNPDALG
ncbi:MAG TPA: DUF3152 domain-containing protein [Actinomycetaceae bacterium]|nr:DUF3152 domain-containing protein [Actinomycetaceae bacterium]